MGFLFDFLIPALIVVGVAFVWFRALFSKFIPPARGRGVQTPRQAEPHPRSLASSGGFERATPASQTPTRNVPAQRQWQGYEPTEDVEKPRPKKPEPQANNQAGWMQRHPRVAETPQARLLARALDNPESTRTAFLIKEVLDEPVSMREGVTSADRRM